MTYPSSLSELTAKPGLEQTWASSGLPYPQIHSCVSQALYGRSGRLVLLAASAGCIPAGLDHWGALDGDCRVARSQGISPSRSLTSAEAPAEAVSPLWFRFLSA